MTEVAVRGTIECRNTEKSFWRSHILLSRGQSEAAIALHFVIAFRAQSGIKTMTGSLVSVVDDDESVRESLPRLIKTFGHSVLAFSSAEDFLASGCLSRTECLILDVTMPGMSGPELQSELKRRQLAIPIIFITARRDETVRASMREQGAVECLFKPFSPAALLGAINTALRI